MTTATPMPPSQATYTYPPVATPVEPRKNGHTLLWLILGGLALLLTVGVATLVFLASGNDEAAVVNDHQLAWSGGGRRVFADALESRAEALCLVVGRYDD